jgi:uncharacterized protein (DUF1810 family)
MADDPFDLARFLTAQAPVYAYVVAELRAGRKESHWMWFVFPQMRGLGFSPAAHRFGIGSLEEARAYVRHPVLGTRLTECAELVLRHRSRSAREILGSPDDLKLRSSMTLFAELSEPGSPFHTALAKYCGGKPDPKTLELFERL